MNTKNETIDLGQSEDGNCVKACDPCCDSTTSPSEPNYPKLYIDDAEKLADFPKSGTATIEFCIERKEERLDNKDDAEGYDLSMTLQVKNITLNGEIKDTTDATANDDGEMEVKSSVEEIGNLMDEFLKSKKK